MNYEMEQFKKNLINLINNSGIVVGAAYYIMKDCLMELSKAYSDAIKSEIEEKDKVYNSTTTVASEPSEPTFKTEITNEVISTTEEDIDEIQCNM